MWGVQSFFMGFAELTIGWTVRQPMRSTRLVPISRSKRATLLTKKMGEWEGVNNFVYDKSNRSVDRFSDYSLLENPMTSCG